ncbi:MAG: threonine synthase [Lachnospiraceae bacterium]|nr:threonine synthase [Lachnospiraceae bacterium]
MPKEIHDMLYNSTRDKSVKLTASEAILKGLSDDGGLFVPESLPSLKKTMKELSGLKYNDIAYEIMSLFLDDFTEAELRECIDNAYGDNFDDPEIAPMSYADGSYYLELFHGPTIAFKDLALQILPHLMTASAKKNGVSKDIVILTATSGDTGKAAMAGFADVPHTRIMVFFPHGGVSDVQRLQMVTQKGANVSVVSVDGNFDDCQTGVKQIFNDASFRAGIEAEGCQFSSANSINIGRLVPQIVYYVYAYCNLLKNEKISDGDKINICVPTGNFGNILAAYLAKKIGLPVDRLICASNINNVLTDFFTTGTYDINRAFHLTMSPSMDILISSNLERLIYFISGCDDKATASFMSDLSSKGSYTITDSMKAELGDFIAGCASEEETAAEIKRIYEDTGYVIDTHTAVASSVANRLRSGGSLTDAPVIIASTASPYKFARSIVNAIKGDNKTGLSDLEMIDELKTLTDMPEPQAIKEIRHADVRHNGHIAINEMKSAVRDFLERKVN